MVCFRKCNLHSLILRESHQSPSKNLSWLFLLVQKKHRKNNWIPMPKKKGVPPPRWNEISLGCRAKTCLEHPKSASFTLKSRSRSLGQRGHGFMTTKSSIFLGHMSHRFWGINLHNMYIYIYMCKHRTRLQVVNIYFAYWWHLSVYIYIYTPLLASCNISSSQSIPCSKGLSVKVSKSDSTEQQGQTDLARKMCEAMALFLRR